MKRNGKFSDSSRVREIERRAIERDSEYPNIGSSIGYRDLAISSSEKFSLSLFAFCQQAFYLSDENLARA